MVQVSQVLILGDRGERTGEGRGLAGKLTTGGLGTCSELKSCTWKVPVSFLSWPGSTLGACPQDHHLIFLRLYGFQFFTLGSQILSAMCSYSSCNHSLPFIHSHEHHSVTQQTPLIHSSTYPENTTLFSQKSFIIHMLFIHSFTHQTPLIHSLSRH